MMERKPYQRREENRERGKSERRSHRLSVLNEKRQTLQCNDSPDPDEPKKPVVTRRILLEQATKNAAAQRATDMKKRKEATSKEILKARPPFNNFVRVVHTGYSPYRPLHPLKSKINPVGTSSKKPPVARAISNAFCGNRRAAPSRTTATRKMHEDVVIFGSGNSNIKTVFKPPAPVKPLPLMLPPKAPSRQEVKPEVQNYKPAPKKVLPPTKNANSKQVKNAGKDLRTQAKVPKKARSSKRNEPKPQVIGSKPVRANRIELPEKKKGPPLNDKTNLLPKRLRAVATFNYQMEGKMLRKAAVPSSSRVLRSSTKLQPVISNDQENEPPVKNDLPITKNVTPLIKEKVAPLQQKVELPVLVSSDNEVEDQRSLDLAKQKERLNHEIQRLSALASEWQIIVADTPMPSKIADEIDAVTGQTNLLLTKKFKQFEGLVTDAYTNQGTTLDDLNGFWDMMYIQVDQLDIKYKNLAAIKSANWESHTPQPKRGKNKKV